jgi:sensor histidine kinase regulating citrate/malate metabolism
MTYLLIVSIIVIVLLIAYSVYLQIIHKQMFEDITNKNITIVSDIITKDTATLKTIETERTKVLKDLTNKIMVKNMGEYVMMGKNQDEFMNSLAEESDSVPIEETEVFQDKDKFVKAIKGQPAAAQRGEKEENGSSK